MKDYSKQQLIEACGRTDWHERFWSKVDKSKGHGPDGDCWAWTAGKTSEGYGQFSLRSANIAAHIVSYAAFRGPLENGKFVLHSCDHRPCVRPEHLRLGTPVDNAEDCRSYGRLPQRETHGCAKLTMQQANQMRQMYAQREATQQELTNVFKVGITTGRERLVTALAQTPQTIRSDGA
jgi:hypothetical protein